MLDIVKIRDRFDIENAAEHIVKFKTRCKMEELYKIGLEQDILMIFIIEEYCKNGSNISLKNVCKKVCNITKEKFESISFESQREDVDIELLILGGRMLYEMKQVVYLYMDLGEHNPLEDLKNRCLRYIENNE